MAHQSLTASIWRMLAWRIGAVALIVCAIFATIAYVNGQQRLEATVTELAVMQVDRFNRQAMEIFDRPGQFDPALVREELENFSSASGTARLEDGYFVLARVLDATGNELAQVADRDHPRFSAVNERVDIARFVPLAAGEHSAVTVAIEGAPYVGVAVALTNSAGAVVGQVIGAFAVSEAALETMRGNIFRTIGYVIAIILATALSIYPIIGGLLGAHVQADGEPAGRQPGNHAGAGQRHRETRQRHGCTQLSGDRLFRQRWRSPIGLPREQIQALIKDALLHDVGKLESAITCC